MIPQPPVLAPMTEGYLCKDFTAPVTLVLVALSPVGPCRAVATRGLTSSVRSIFVTGRVVKV